jgi:hypothetical protein
MLISSIKTHAWLPILIAVITAIFVVLLVDNAPAYAIDSNNCLQCHSNPDLKKTNGNGESVSLYVNEERANTAAHRYIECTTCHSDNPHQSPSELDKLSLAQKCGTCHQYEYNQHVESIHGQQLVLGNRDVATCVNCHSEDNSPHSVIRVLEYNAPAFKKNIAQTCSKCHAQEKLMSSYGIVEKVYESYMRSFHGKALQLGTYETTELDKATCTNCHGVHDIKAANDPTSPVAGLDNLAKTCDTCHPGGGVKFASGFLGHKEASPSNIPVAHYAEIFFKIFLISVISFGVIIMILAVRKYWATKWKEEK